MSQVSESRSAKIKKGGKFRKRRKLNGEGSRRKRQMPNSHQGNYFEGQEKTMLGMPVSADAQRQKRVEVRRLTRHSKSSTLPRMG